MDIVKPVEDFIFQGLVTRVQQVFGCPAIITTANDKQAALQRMFDGRDVEYPYAFLVPQTLSYNTESYNSNRLVRKGLMVTVDGNQGRAVRILPTNFDFEIEFVTNKFLGGQGSVLGFEKRWLFARRAGWLKFNVDFGRLRFPISLTLSEQVPTPLGENKTEAESKYSVTTTLTVHGYVSEEMLATQGVVATIEMQMAIAGVGAQFFPFN